MQRGPEYDQGERGREMEGVYIRLSSQQQYQHNLVHEALSGKSASSIRNEKLIHNGKCYTSSRAKATTFMHRYTNIRRLDIHTPSRSKKPIRHTLNTPSVDEECCQAVNLAELSVAIKSMKPKGAPGRDRTPPHDSPTLYVR